MSVGPDRPGTGGDRRALLKRVLGLGAGLALLPRRTFAQASDSSARPKAGDHLVKAGDPGLTPLTLDDLPAGAPPLQAWALEPSTKVVRSGSRLNLVLLARLDPAALSPGTRDRAAEGVVAFSAICTHEGCDIGSWTAEQLLHCECHESRFDPRDGGRVVDGPAPRSLPALPLTVAGGLLVVARPFTSRVGGEVV